MSEIALIWAESRDGVIGAAGGMPWHVSHNTTGSTIIGATYSAKVLLMNFA